MKKFLITLVNVILSGGIFTVVIDHLNASEFEAMEDGVTVTTSIAVAPTRRPLLQHRVVPQSLLSGEPKGIDYLRKRPSNNPYDPSRFDAGSYALRRIQENFRDHSPDPHHQLFFKRRRHPAPYGPGVDSFIPPDRLSAASGREEVFMTPLESQEITDITRTMPSGILCSSYRDRWEFTREEGILFWSSTQPPVAQDGTRIKVGPRLFVDLPCHSPSRVFSWLMYQCKDRGFFPISRYSINVRGLQFATEIILLESQQENEGINRIFSSNLKERSNLLSHLIPTLLCNVNFSTLDYNCAALIQRGYLKRWIGSQTGKALYRLAENTRISYDPIENSFCWYVGSQRSDPVSGGALAMIYDKLSRDQRLQK